MIQIQTTAGSNNPGLNSATVNNLVANSSFEGGMISDGWLVKGWQLSQFSNAGGRYFMVRIVSRSLPAPLQNNGDLLPLPVQPSTQYSMKWGENYE